MADGPRTPENQNPLKQEPQAKSREGLLRKIGKMFGRRGEVLENAVKESVDKSVVKPDGPVDEGRALRLNELREKLKIERSSSGGKNESSGDDGGDEEKDNGDFERAELLEKIEVVKEKTLWALKQMGENLDKDSTNINEKDNFLNALKNIDFIEEKIGPIVEEFVSRTGRQMHLIGDREAGLSESGDEIYFHTEYGLCINRVGRMGNQSLTPELLQEMWDKNDDRGLLKELGMSKQKLVDRFRSEIKRR